MVVVADAVDVVYGGVVIFVVNVVVVVLLIVTDLIIFHCGQLILKANAVSLWLGWGGMGGMQSHFCAKHNFS